MEVSPRGLAAGMERKSKLEAKGCSWKQAVWGGGGVIKG